MAFTHIAGDAFPELYVVQNFFGPQLETGRMNGGVSVLLKNINGSVEPVWPNRSHLLVAGDATALTVADLNSDGLPDFHVAVNAGVAMAFEANPQHYVNEQLLCLKLKGRDGNPDASGARVTVSGEVSLTQQVSTGGGAISRNPLKKNGAGEEIRTLDIDLGKVALYR